MASLIFIRAVWSIWLIGSLFLTGFSLSNYLFRSLEKRPTQLRRDLLAVVAWPLMLLSPAGRKRLKQTMKGIL